MATGPIFISLPLPNSEAYMSSKLLIEEAPLLVLPSLARRVGVNEALLLQQVHYLLNRREFVEDGVVWTSRSYEEWGEKLTHCSARTIQRIALSLERRGLLKTRQGVRSSWDRTKYYTIDYERLDQLEDQIDHGANLTQQAAEIPANTQLAAPEAVDASCQNGAIDSAKLTSSIAPNWRHVYIKKKEQRKTEEPLVLTSQEAKPKQEKEARDLRWNPIREDLKLYWDTKNPGVEMPFNGKIDGKAVKEFLRDFPLLTQEQWRQYLQHRARSEVIHSEPIRYWIRRLMSYYESPLDRYGRKFDVGGKHDQAESLNRNNREHLSKWLSGGSGKASAPGGLPVQVRGVLEPPGK